MRLTSTLSLTLAVAGCTSGLASSFPKPLDPRTSATIIVARNDNITGFAKRASLTLDGFEIAKLNTGEYVSFSVPPGNHAVGPKGHTITLNFEAGQEYFLWISPHNYELDVERLRLEEGRRRSAGYRDLSLPTCFRIQLSPRDTTIRIGEGFPASVDLSSCDGSQHLTDIIRWQSADPNVVSVDSISGVVVGRRAGEARIDATGKRVGRVSLHVVVQSP